MEASACSPPCARSVGWSAPSTWTEGPGPGAGCPGTKPGASSSTCLAEHPDHAAHHADQVHVRGHDRLVGRVLGDQLHVAVAALEALDGRVAIHQRHHDRAVGGFLLGTYEHEVAVQDAGVDHAFAPHA